jgi:phage shock protein B
MHGSEIADIIAVAGGIGIGMLVALGVLIIIGIKVWRGPKSSSGMANADEARMIQEIYHGLARMEQRVETLETLLLDQHKKGAVK